MSLEAPIVIARPNQSRGLNDIPLVTCIHITVCVQTKQVKIGMCLRDRKSV